MKIDTVRLIIAAGLSLLIGWGYYTMSTVHENAMSIGIATGIEMLLACLGGFCIEYKECSRAGVVIRITCIIGAILFLILNGIFAGVGPNTAFYIISGILALLMLLVVNSVYRTKQ